VYASWYPRTAPRATPRSPCELAKWEHLSYLDTLAARAECGEFPAAVERLQQALAQREYLTAFRQRLQLYRQGKPFRNR
jgi:hypothetical protein